MSEDGWQELLRADGVQDWVVLHGGATAAFRVGSLTEATRLAEAIAGGVEAALGIVLTMTSNRLAARLTRDVWGLEPEVT